jgi:putative transposase
MPEYRRSVIPGGTFFFTVVTYRRQPILITEDARQILRWAWMEVKNRFPFTTDAIRLLPDHLHCIWTLPENDSNYSVRWKEIKRLFSQKYRCKADVESQRNASREKRGEACIWQRRFWEHTLRDEKDLQRHLDYIHYNPVKHGLVQQVRDWQWSSFHRYVQMEFYDVGWGGGNGKDIPLSYGEGENL